MTYPENHIEHTGRSIALVVDDNPESLGMVSAALEKEGMTVLVARDGASAIRLAHRVQPDVILMDAMMPEMDGFETCHTLKFGDDPIDAPIIFMTGLSDHEHIIKGLRAGGVDYVTKPVVLDELLARIGTHVSNAKLILSAREAAASFGGSVLALDGEGQILWGAGKALSWLKNEQIPTQTPQVADWLRKSAAQSAPSPLALGPFRLSLVCLSAAQEFLVRLSHATGFAKEEILSERFDLTHREAEILYWLTLGKTNKDISVILELSARTVNKHLEQVFQKLGVDNRTAAAVQADRALLQRIE